MKNRTPVTKVEINSQTLDGNAFTNSMISQNKLTVVNIWGTYCGFCVKELTVLQEVFDEFRDSQVGVVGIAIDIPMNNFKEKDLHTAKRIIQENGITYPNIYLDTKLKTYLSDKVFLVPTTIFINSNGYVIHDTVENVCTKMELERIITEILHS